MKRSYLFFLTFSVLMVYFVACNQSPTSTDSNPNVIGGETNLDLTKVGNYFSVYIITNPPIIELENFENNTEIIENDNGIVTFYHQSTFDSTFIEGLNRALGLEALPDHLKLPAIAQYAKRIGAKLDTTDKARMTLTAEFKVKITSEGMQEYFGNSNLSTPHTLVKYAWSVGNVYEFTNTEGIKVKRTVVSKSTTEDYKLSHLKIKVIKVEETKEDPLIDKITYVVNEKYGLVGIVVNTKTGKEIKLTVFPVSLF